MWQSNDVEATLDFVERIVRLVVIRRCCFDIVAGVDGALDGRSQVCHTFIDNTLSLMWHRAWRVSSATTAEIQHNLLNILIQVQAGRGAEHRAIRGRFRPISVWHWRHTIWSVRWCTNTPTNRRKMTRTMKIQRLQNVTTRTSWYYSEAVIDTRLSVTTTTTLLMTAARQLRQYKHRVCKPHSTEWLGGEFWGSMNCKNVGPSTNNRCTVTQLIVGNIKR